MFVPPAAACVGLEASAGRMLEGGVRGDDSHQCRVGAGAEALTLAGCWPPRGAGTRSWAVSMGRVKLPATTMSASRPVSQRNEEYLTTAPPVQCRMQNAECRMKDRPFSFCILHSAFCITPCRCLSAVAVVVRADEATSNTARFTVNDKASRASGGV